MTSFKKLVLTENLTPKDILIGDIMFNHYYQCTGEVIDLDLSIDEVVVKWDDKKAGTETIAFSDLSPFTMLSVRK